MIVESHEFQYTINLKAIVTVPDNFDPKKESLPMIVFLHGAGERGDNLELLKAYGIPRIFTADNNFAGLRVITLSPQCPANMVWTQIEDQTMEFIDMMAKKYNADPDRISLSGVSMGAFGTWALACSHAGYFSAYAPICGGGMAWRAAEIGKTPIRAFHGAKDDIVIPERSKEMVEAVNKAGGKATLTIFEGWGHNSWIPAFEGDELVKFLAESHR